MNKSLTTLTAAILVALAGAANAAAPEMADSLRAQVAKSDLVFVGSVTDVAYALSGQDGDAQRIPHTFVTYDVEQVLQGQADDKSVTLRFIGGRGEKSAFLAVSGQPMFDLGDRDVLMVAGNGTSACPLVGCSDGRYRLIKDNVYSEEGQAVEIRADGKLNKDGFYDLEEVMTHKVSQTTLRLVDQFDAGESRLQADRPHSADHVSAEQLLERVATTAREVGRATPAVFRSVNAKAPFSIAVADEAAPAVAKTKAQEPRTGASVQDLAEEAALRANGGNPVLDTNNDRQDGVK